MQIRPRAGDLVSDHQDPRTLHPMYCLDGGPFDGKRIRIVDTAGFIIMTEQRPLPPPGSGSVVLLTQAVPPQHVYVRTDNNRFIYDGLKR